MIIYTDINGTRTPIEIEVESFRRMATQAANVANDEAASRGVNVAEDGSVVVERDGLVEVFGVKEIAVTPSQDGTIEGSTEVAFPESMEKLVSAVATPEDVVGDGATLETAYVEVRKKSVAIYAAAKTTKQIKMKVHYHLVGVAKRRNQYGY